MTLILSIETSTDVCSVAVHQDGQLIATQRYDLAKSHSSLLAPLIDDLLYNADIEITHLSAIAVSAGPGSYTGLRIGVSTAKGIAFAKNIPIIAIDSLDTMYEAFRPFHHADFLAMPMMDARRMEVYCQLRNQNQEYLIESKPLIVENGILDKFLRARIFIFGNGAEKTIPILGSDQVVFIPDIVPEALNMGKLAFQKYQKEDFEDTAYFEPSYLKEYRTIQPKKKF